MCSERRTGGPFTKVYEQHLSHQSDVDSCSVDLSRVLRSVYQAFDRFLSYKSGIFVSSKGN